MIAVSKRLGPDDLLRNPLETRGRQEIRSIRGCSRVFAILNIVAGQWRIQLRPLHQRSFFECVARRRHSQDIILPQQIKGRRKKHENPQPSGMKGIIVVVANKERQEPIAPSIFVAESQKQERAKCPLHNSQHLLRFA